MSGLNWKTNFEELEDGAKILTEMKHGFISGRWNKEDQSCHGYYWQDIEWSPTRYVFISEI